MNCLSCCYIGVGDGDAGACDDCYNDLKAKVDFLRLSQQSSFSDVVLFASDGGNEPVPAHKAVLVSRSPVFKAMLENEMEESLSGTIKIADVSYEALRAFVHFLYTAKPEICIDHTLACDLLILAEKYEVHHLKDYCQTFLASKLNWDNVFMTYTFAHQHNAKDLIDAALDLITDDMGKVTGREEYAELKKKDPQLVIEICEAYISKKVTAEAVLKESSGLGGGYYEECTNTGHGHDTTWGFGSI